MRITILTLGSRGDVQPYLSFAKYAVSKGHEVVICTGKTFKTFIEDNGVCFAEAESDLMAMLETPEGQIVFNHALRHPIVTKRFVSEVVNPAFRKTLDQFWEASQDADVIVYHPKAFGAPDIALKLGIPCISMPPVPITYPIEEFPNLAISSTGNFGKILNKLTYQLLSKSESASIKEVNAFRQETLGLDKRKSGQYHFKVNGQSIPVIYPISQYLFEDVTSWNGKVKLPGFLFLDNDEKNLDPVIEAFINAGDAPIVISFSSMPLKDPEAFKSKLESALINTNNRAIVLVGISGMIFEDSDRILAIKGAPHTLLFPRAKGIIHHGGVGTVAAALKSGKPQLIIPFGVDQPFWANRLYLQEIALKPIREKELTQELLIERFKSMEDKNVIDKAWAFKAKIDSEDGNKNTLDYIESSVLK